MEFRSLGSLELDPGAPGASWAVDNLWISIMEFGELGSLERTTDQPSKD